MESNGFSLARNIPMSLPLIFNQGSTSTAVFKIARAFEVTLEELVEVLEE
jgi:hypothetical protein